LPFEDDRFDLVVLNGVLEWIPASIEGNPREIQQAFLTEICRVLSDDGQLYVGIENRYGASYFKGKREEHTKLPYVSLLPRFMGRPYHRLALGSSYRCYTYGRGDLKRLLRDSGFHCAAFSYPYPDYREFSQLVDLEDLSSVRNSFSPSSWKGKLLFAISRHTGVLRWFANSFGVVASKEKRITSYVDRLLRRLSEEGVLGSEAAPKRYSITGTAQVSLVVDSVAGSFLISLPLDRRAEGRLNCDVDVRESLRARSLSSSIEERILEPRSGKFDGVTYKLDKLCFGKPAEDGASAGIMTGAFEWINQFHEETRHSAFPKISERFSGAVSLLLNDLPADDRVRYEGMLERSDDSERVMSSIHGDYHSLNILRENGRIAAVIDWDLGQESAAPMWDYLTYLVQLEFQAGKTWADAFGWAAEQVLTPDSEACGLASEKLTAMGIREKDMMYDILTFPVFQLWAKMVHGDGRTGVIIGGLAHHLHRILHLMSDSKG